VATNYKVLGQSAPSATIDTTLYTVPASTQAVVSTISVSNRANTTATFRIAVRPDGASIANQHYVAYDVQVDGNATIPWTIGITLGDTDVITVYASTADLSFNAFGSEITA
jgi:glucose-6-phosphate dehydrogenase assembly protein OpcA